MNLPDALVAMTVTVTVGGFALAVLKVFDRKGKIPGNGKKIVDFASLFRILKEYVKRDDCIASLVKSDLYRGEKAFKEIRKEQGEMAKMLARIDERTKLWAQSNGYEKG